MDLTEFAKINLCVKLCVEIFIHTQNS
ncbi:protein of unknown function [Magnetospirillum sp. XM-1]|nr:protein of unknown function [Magnetospirillum sp. XM-1]